MFKKFQYQLGLSLCIQGTLYIKWCNIAHPRFIPVYTGNSASQKTALGLFSVYPCVYRELSFSRNGFHFFSGLSLCIQGTLLPFAIILGLTRFIPVYTGNSADAIASMFGMPVYPCVYRELK